MTHRPAQSSCEQAQRRLNTLEKCHPLSYKLLKFKTHLKIIIHITLQHVITVVYLKRLVIYIACQLFEQRGDVIRLGRRHYMKEYQQAARPGPSLAECVGGGGLMI